jgi:hypothetical protein
LDKRDNFIGHSLNCGAAAASIRSLPELFAPARAQLLDFIDDQHSRIGVGNQTDCSVVQFVEACRRSNIPAGRAHNFNIETA